MAKNVQAPTTHGGHAGTNISTGGGGTGTAPPPTGGQLWPRGK